MSRIGNELLKKQALEAAQRMFDMRDHDMSIAHSGGYGPGRRIEAVDDTRALAEYVLRANGLGGPFLAS